MLRSLGWAEHGEKLHPLRSELPCGCPGCASQSSLCVRSAASRENVLRPGTNQP